MLARFSKCRSGVAAIEAAIVFPILIALLIGTIEFSFVLYTNNAIQTAARDVSRQLAVNWLPASAVEAAIAERVPSWAADAISVSLEQSTGVAASNLITVSVSLAAVDATPLRFFVPALGDVTLTSSVTMKQEQPL